jgi:hypothetical protein
MWIRYLGILLGESYFSIPTFANFPMIVKSTNTQLYANDAHVYHGYMLSMFLIFGS